MRTMKLREIKAADLRIGDHIMNVGTVEWVRPTLASTLPHRHAHDRAHYMKLLCQAHRGQDTITYSDDEILLVNRPEQTVSVEVEEVDDVEHAE